MCLLSQANLSRPEQSPGVVLSVSEGPGCHPERSEGSGFTCRPERNQVVILSVSEESGFFTY